MTDAYTDPAGVITVRLDGGLVDGISIGNRWRTVYDPRALGEALTQLLTSALPPQHSVSYEDTPAPGVVGELSESSARAFWEELAQYQHLLARRRQRAAAGVEAVNTPAVPRTVFDARRRVGVSYAEGRFESVAVDPDWADRVSVSELGDRICEALTQHPLWPPAHADPELAQIDQHRRNFLSYLRS